MPLRHSHPPTTRHRWRLLAAKAEREHIQVRRLEPAGPWIATSASNPGAAYVVDGQSCTCPAGLRRIPCKHVAALLVAIGAL